jgi:hypothetical protein
MTGWYVPRIVLCLGKNRSWYVSFPSSDIRPKKNKDTISALKGNNLGADRNWNQGTPTSITIILVCSRNDQQYALICTTPLFYILAPTCFGSSLPSSGTFLNPSDLFGIQIEWVVYHISCGYVTCVRVVVVPSVVLPSCAEKHNTQCDL